MIRFALSIIGAIAVLLLLLEVGAGLYLRHRRHRITGRDWWER